jgi:hypothetical protein
MYIMDYVFTQYINAHTLYINSKKLTSLIMQIHNNYVKLHNNQDGLRIQDIIYGLCTLWIHQTTVGEMEDPVHVTLKISVSAISPCVDSSGPNRLCACGAPPNTLHWFLQRLTRTVRIIGKTREDKYTT